MYSKLELETISLLRDMRGLSLKKNSPQYKLESHQYGTESDWLKIDAAETQIKYEALVVKVAKLTPLERNNLFNTLRSNSNLDDPAVICALPWQSLQNFFQDVKNELPKQIGNYKNAVINAKESLKDVKGAARKTDILAKFKADLSAATTPESRRALIESFEKSDDYKFLKTHRIEIWSKKETAALIAYKNIVEEFNTSDTPKHT